MKKYKFITLITLITMLLSVTVINANANTSITVGRAVTKSSTSVSVPIRVSDNTGICGAALLISYDNALVLTGISSGSALSSLTMTKPGDFSQNPFNIVWDGLEADNSNGTMAVLTFTVPTNPGTYNISALYNDGDIVDGNLNPVDIKINQGQIKVVTPKNIVVEIADKKVTMTGENESDNTVIVAFYNSDKVLMSVKSYANTDNPIKISNTENATYAKVMLWESMDTMRPLDEAQTITLK